MTDRIKVFAHWNGEAVEVENASGRLFYGTLQEVNEWGAVFPLPVGSEERLSPALFPWHRINKIRLLEPEEKAEHGL